jgi:hypothetical protein
MGSYVDEVVKRVGTRHKLVRRTYKVGRVPIAEKFFTEEPTPGQPGSVTRTYFNSSAAAERALSSLKGPATRRRTWELRPVSDNWRLPR